MKLTKIIEKLYNNQLETTKQVDAIQAHANNLKGLNLDRLKLIDKLDKIEAEVSGNPVQLNLGEAEVLKPTSEDKYIIMKSDKTYCQYANGKKAFEVTEAINNTRDLEVIKFGFTEAKMITGSTLYGDACFNAEMIKLYPEVSGNKTKAYRLDFLDKEGSRTNWVLYPAMLISDVQTMLHLILKDFQTNNIRSEYALYLIADCIKKGESLRSGEWHLHPTKSQPSGNIEQLKEVVQELESDHTCTHPHWEETPTKNIIIKTCSTCGAQKYE